MSEQHDLHSHVAVCDERYKNLLNKFRDIESKLDRFMESTGKRLDKYNGRWFSVMAGFIIALGGGCISMIVYIFVNSV